MVLPLLDFGGDPCSYASAVSILVLLRGIASGEKHTCPGGRCQGRRLRNDIFLLTDKGTYIFTDTETCVKPFNQPKMEFLVKEFYFGKFFIIRVKDITLFAEFQSLPVQQGFRDSKYSVIGTTSRNVNYPGLSCD
jgi:hypothetical protein